MDKLYIQISEACKLLGISKPTLYKLIGEKILPAVFIGTKYRLNRVDVESLAKTGWVWADANSQTN